MLNNWTNSWCADWTKAKFKPRINCRVILAPSMCLFWCWKWPQRSFMSPERPNNSADTRSLISRLNFLWTGSGDRSSVWYFYTNTNETLVHDLKRYRDDLLAALLYIYLVYLWAYRQWVQSRVGRVATMYRVILRSAGAQR